jgi:hypothetical protein
VNTLFASMPWMFESVGVVFFDDSSLHSSGPV